MILCKKIQIDQLLDLAELLNLSYRTEIIPDFRKNRIPDPEFFGLKPSPDQDGANKKRFSQIGPAVPEVMKTYTDRQTDTHTDKNPYYFVVLIYFNFSVNFY